MVNLYSAISKKKNILGFVIEPIFSIYQKYYKKKSVETKLIYFFAWLFFILWIKLFFLQVLDYKYYEDILYWQHSSQTQLEPKRWNIYILDKDDTPISLTQNIDLYEIYADPYVIYNKEKVSEILTPIIYNHFCTMYMIDKPLPIECIKNIENFTKEKILETDNTFLLIGSGDNSGNTILTPTEEENIEINEKDLKNKIKKRLSYLLEKREISNVYIGFFEDTSILETIKKSNLNWVIIDGYYVYVNIDKISSKTKVINRLSNILERVDNKYTREYLKKKLTKRPQRYVKIVNSVNPIWKKELNKVKNKYKTEKINKIPLLHGIWTKKEPFRFYPYGSFLANVIGYIDDGQWKWWIEGYFDEILKGKEWKIVGMNTPWIWQIASNSLEIQQPKNGANIYLTIDYTMQKKVEQIVQYYFSKLKPDSISVTVMDPYNWDIKSMVTYPSFDVNSWKDIYKYKTLPTKYRYILNDETYHDIPILIETGGNLIQANSKQRVNPKLKKYIYENIYGPRVFRNQNISDPYEPGSIFKTITVGVGIDSDSISMYDYYQDNGSVDIWPYTISNVDKKCKWYHTYLHALERSCNVWMVRIIQKIWKDVFYNYMAKLGFGSLTNIQLEDESPGAISALDNYSLARFYNNSFGLWILVTPIQIATVYSSLINGGYLVRPNIVKKIENWNNIVENKKYIIDKVFGDKISDNIKYALWSTIYEWDLFKLAVENFTFGGKTGTSSISYKWKYRWWNGWTRGSFAGIVTKENTKYVIVVKVERPRTCEWGLCSAGLIFQDIGKFIVDYDGIKK